MKKILCFVLFCLCLLLAGQAQDFNDYFENKTLRIDYLFSGNDKEQKIYLDELSQFPQWAGRRHRLSEFPLKGNGQVEMRDVQSGKIIYRHSFATLFQEWQTTEEARTVSRSFENTFLFPYPKKETEITVRLFDNRGKESAIFKHTVRPEDILIRQRGTSPASHYQYLHKSGTSEECIDIAILPEGYTEEEMDLFLEDANRTVESLFAHEPFKQMKERFNVVAVKVPSADSGVSSPGKQIWKSTAFGSHFDTFYSSRYLTTSRVKEVHNALAGIPYEHIIILANTDQYGGGGIYNAFTLTTAHNISFRPVVVHEFGHSFAGLADEYYYEGDLFSDTYPFDTEPWEQNITTLKDFPAKWEDMLPENTPMPTPVSPNNEFPVGVYEGGGYSAKGIYRPAVNCRMRDNQAADFCPVCQRAIRRLIEFYTYKP